MTLTVADDSAKDRVNVAVAAAAIWLRPAQKMGCGLGSHNRVVGATGGRRKRTELSNADVVLLASQWPDRKHVFVNAVPQLFIDVHLPRLRLAEVKLFLYFCRHIPTPSQPTSPSSISVTFQEMADSVGLSRDMAMKAVRVLEMEKLIICARPRGRRANQYRICWSTFRARPS